MRSSTQAPADVAAAKPAEAEPSARPVLWWVLLVAAVPVSSVLGLLGQILLGDGWDKFVAIWATNLWADLVFVLGTLAAVWVTSDLAAWKGRPTGLRFTAAVAAGFLMHYVVYLLSATLSADAPPFFGVHFATPKDGLVQVLVDGLPGLAAMAFAGPLIGIFLTHPAAATAPSNPS